MLLIIIRLLRPSSYIYDSSDSLYPLSESTALDLPLPITAAFKFAICLASWAGPVRMVLMELTISLVFIMYNSFKFVRI